MREACVDQVLIQVADSDIRIEPDSFGANVTKDRLVQGKSANPLVIATEFRVACMRMRKLDKGQSVGFCLPEEIKTKILTCTFKPGNASIDVLDVLSWPISETCIDVRWSMPLWAAQGKRFEHQSTLWAEARTNGEILMSKGPNRKSRTLEDRYRPRSSTDVTSFVQTSQHKNLTSRSLK
jgi:hypothetical protein